MKILVVDDSVVNLEIVKSLLLDIISEKEIILCSEPIRTQKIIDEENIDILLLDVIMPIIDGFEILKNLRSDEKYKQIPIIMLTSLTDKLSFKKCFELGANDYIKKPIDKDEFFARIKVAISSRKNLLNLKSIIDLSASQNRELKEVNDKLLDAKMTLMQAEKMAAIGQLAAGIAHEINNPFSFVSSNFEVLSRYFKRVLEYFDAVDEYKKQLLDSNSDELNNVVEKLNFIDKRLKLGVIKSETKELISDSVTGIKRVSEIVQSLRIFSRSSKNDEKEFGSLNELVKQVLLILRNESKYVAEIEVIIPENCELTCNRGQIAQVLLNIIMNAVQAIKSQERKEMGHIAVAVDRVNEFITINISDDGPGIRSEHINKIFNPFFTTKEVGAGTGLGLSISYDIIVNKHRGTIDVKSELGIGTEFIISLPIKLEEQFSNENIPMFLGGKPEESNVLAI